MSSREEWEKKLVDGINQLGLTTERKEFPFPDAANVYSPAFMQSALNFVATARAELLPPDGPVKIMIEGLSSPELEDQSQRVQAWMNLFLTEIADEYYSDTEQALFWTALQGSVFKKTYFDPYLNRPTSSYIKPQDFIVNFGATSLKTAMRLTHVLDLTAKEIKMRQESGMYRDIGIEPKEYGLSDQDQVDDRINQVQGITQNNSEYMSFYRLYECHCELDLEDLSQGLDISRPKKTPSPYIVTIDTQSKKILSIYRNWEEEDKDRKRIEYFTHLIFLTGLGFYGYGLAHICGGSAQAATTLLRQIMDAGMLANFPGGLRRKGLRVDENNIRIGPTEFAEIDTGDLPIDQAVMMMPYKEPSATLYSLYEKLEDGVLKLAAAGDQPLADFNPNAPVGTTLALLEQTHKIQSSIIRRLHQAFKSEFKILFRLFGKTLPEEPYPFNVPGKSLSIMRSDFSENFKIVPVSDPNLSSSTQRLIVWEAIYKFATENPDLHNMRQVLRKIYESMKVPDIDSILIPEEEPEKPKPVDPITENKMAMVGEALNAFVWQDHGAHITVHSQLANDPMIQQSNPEIIPILQAHIKEHMSLGYLVQMQQSLGITIPKDPTKLNHDEQNQIAAMAAQAVQQMQQQQQQQMPQQPMDPTLALLEEVKVKAMEVQETSRINEMRIQFDTMKLQQDSQLRQQELAQKQQEAQYKAQIDQMRIEIERYKAEAQYHQKESELLQKMQQFTAKEIRETSREKMQDEKEILETLTRPNTPNVEV